MFPSLKLYKGQLISMEELLPLLLDFGYNRQEEITREGEFSRRAGIIDIWPLTFELPLRIEWEFDKILSLRSIDLPSAKSFWDHTVVIILSTSKATRTQLLHFKEDLPFKNFLDIKFNDLLVHNRYGIGRFLGLDKIKVAGKCQEHLVIEYQGGEKLFVPLEQVHLVQKYSAFGLRRPKLNKLGSKEWIRTKGKVRKGIEQLSWELLSTEAMRKARVGFRYSKDTTWQKEFESGFVFQETPGQVKAWNEVKDDMESVRPMDRLLCGDVGYGKTEVAMRAAYKCVMNNKQVAFLVPTTILAEQHFQNFKKRVEEFPIRVEMLSRLVKQSRQRSIINDLAIGKVDIIIGTHRLLSGAVKFKQLGLVIIDEEQRFGVKSKEYLKHLRLNCEILTLTATPIPRTLYMGLMQLKDISAIDTPPENRLPIKTFVLKYDRDLIRQAILHELKRRGQVYFVHNRILDIEKVRQRLSRLDLGNIRIGVIHGKMPSSLIEATMMQFLNSKIDLLISTAIIESGLDIPNANTLIVDNADSFGLADLHQLRGRVGRFNRPAFAYFLLPNKGVLSTEAEKRLVALQEYSELGSGFRIALEDLEIRGAGNLLGTEQHGYISAVGFDLYCRLLRETMEALKKIKNQISK
ncbi:MAG: DEAD/DEAH box helicase, partial [Candidatus Omnitrophica bacterium]|nr:DEAD/DEAH box helicase [Candidatus Omnitrophota bacterium]